MPAQKRSPEDVDDDLQGNDLENHHGEQMHQDEESNRSSSSDSDDEQDETFALVRLSDVRKEVQCPICLGIIRKTRTVMECLHRFCRECIDKSMRMGNNECPACRTHCASRRSLRDDPNYDALITALYPDIDQYEEEELAFHDEEKARNKQIQASIAETLRRQTEALGKKRKRSQNSYRRRRNYQTDDEDDSNANDDGKDLSSADEIRTKRTRRWRGQPSPSCAGRDGGGDENDMDVSREAGLTSGGLIGTSEILAWGRGGMRSHTRYGSGSSANSKHSRNSRLAKLVDHLRNLDENDKEMDIHLVLVPLNEQKTPGLPQQYLCCRPALSIGQLCEVVARQTSMPADDVEIWAVKELHSQLPSINCQASNSALLDASKDELRLLDLEDTLAGVMSCNPNRGHLILAYRRKVERGHYDRYDTGHSEENTWSSLL